MKIRAYQLSKTLQYTHSATMQTKLINAKVELVTDQEPGGQSNNGVGLHRSAPDQGSGCWKPDKGYDSGLSLHQEAKNHCSPFSQAITASKGANGTRS